MSTIDFITGVTLPIPMSNDSNIHSTRLLMEYNTITERFTGTAGHEAEMNMYNLCDYFIRIDAPNTINQFLSVVAVQVDPCPVTNDDDCTHTALLAVLRGYGDSRHYVYDLPSLLMCGGVENLTVLNGGNEEGFYSSVADAIRSTMSSFRYNGAIPAGWPYALTVFDGTPEVVTDADGCFQYMDLSVNKRLITGGESIYIAPSFGPDTFRFSVGLTYDADTQTMVTMPKAVASQSMVSSAPATVTEPVTDDAIEQMVPMQDYTVPMQDYNILLDRTGRLTEIVEHAQECAIRYTRNNNGCDDGKRQFLTDIGLWCEDDLDEVFEAAGVPTERNYDIEIAVSFVVTARVEASRSAVEECDLDDLGVDLDHIITMHLRNNDADYEIIDVQEV